MSKVLAVGTHATDDPTKASLAFITALGAAGARIDAAIALLGDATYLAKTTVRENVHGVGFAPLSELAAQVVEAGIPVYV